MYNIVGRFTNYELINYALLGGVNLILGVLLEINVYLLLIENVATLAPVLQLAIYFLLAYFFGLVISKTGQLFRDYYEKVLNMVGIKIKLSIPKDFLKAEKEDEKIAVISAERNFLLGAITMCVIFLLLLLYERFLTDFIDAFYVKNILLILLVGLFILSRRRMEVYIMKRVENVLSDKK